MRTSFVSFICAVALATSTIITMPVKPANAQGRKQSATWNLPAVLGKSVSAYEQRLGKPVRVDEPFQGNTDRHYKMAGFGKISLTVRNDTQSVGLITIRFDKGAGKSWKDTRQRIGMGNATYKTFSNPYAKSSFAVENIHPAIDYCAFTPANQFPLFNTKNMGGSGYGADNKSPTEPFNKLEIYLKPAGAMPQEATRTEQRGTVLSLTGKVEEITSGQIVLLVESVTTQDSKTVLLSPPRKKVVVVPASVSVSSDVVAGVRVTVAGEDAGKGKSLTATSVTAIP